MTRLRCAAVKADGSRCGIASGISPGNGMCLWHDPLRSDEAAAARVKGGRERAEQSQGKRFRVVDAAAVPPLATMDDAVLASAWLFRMQVTGVLDPTTVREANRSITTFKDALNKADLLRRIRELERQLKAVEKARAP
ncbi:MAG TPA: hypothetical protein VF142_06840 [Longimicrobium sp.]